MKGDRRQRQQKGAMNGEWRRGGIMRGAGEGRDDRREG